MMVLSTGEKVRGGWLLMGLPGAIYLGDLANAWIAIGLFVGTVLISMKSCRDSWPTV